MRTKFIYIIILLIVGISCKKEESANVNHITFSAYDGTSVLKTAFNAGSALSSTTYSAGDAIGVYMSTVTPATSFLNSPYITSLGGAPAIFTGGLTWQGSGVVHTFYAYYSPSAAPAVTGTPAFTAVPISLSASQDGSVDKYDFLYATATATPIYSTTSEANVAFAFKHAFTIFEFDVTVSSGSANIGSVLTNIQLKSNGSDYVAFSGGTINIATGAIVPPGAKLGTINLTTNYKLAVGTTKYFMVAYPMGGAKALDVILTYGTSTTTVSKAAGWAYTLGNKYTVPCPIP